MELNLFKPKIKYEDGIKYKYFGRFIILLGFNWGFGNFCADFFKLTSLKLFKKLF